MLFYGLIHNIRKRFKYKFDIECALGKIPASEAFDILNKNTREHVLETFGKHGLGKIKDYFVDAVDATVDVNDTSVKKAYTNAIVNGAY